MGERAMIVAEHVGKDKRGAVEPWQAAQGGEIRLEHEIAVALVPARDRVARHRLHVDVVREQIIARVRLFVRALDEVLRVKPLADQTALHVDHGDNYGVDRARFHGPLEVLEAEIGGHARPLPYMPPPPPPPPPALPLVS